MQSNVSRYSILFGVSVAFFLVASLGSDVFARVTIAGEELGPAIANHVRVALSESVRTILLLAPFLALGWMSVSIAQRKGLAAGTVFLCIAGVTSTWIYYPSYQEVQGCIQQGIWSGETLATAFLPMKIVALLLMSLLVWSLIIWGKRNRKGSDDDSWGR